MELDLVAEGLKDPPRGKNWARNQRKKMKEKAAKAKPPGKDAAQSEARAGPVGASRQKEAGPVPHARLGIPNPVGNRIKENPEEANPDEVRVEIRIRLDAGHLIQMIARVVGVFYKVKVCAVSTEATLSLRATRAIPLGSDKLERDRILKVVPNFDAKLRTALKRNGFAVEEIKSKVSQVHSPLLSPMSIVRRMLRSCVASQESPH